MNNPATPDGSALIDAALQYGKLGFEVFPIKPGQKTPLIKDNLKLATTDPEQIVKWWTLTPSANIGIATGPSDLIVVDCDPRHGGDESLAAIIRKVGREKLGTVTALTPNGGQHLYFRSAGYDVRSGTNVLGPGLDIRAKGGYVGAPPSMVDGKAYHWEVGYGPFEREVLSWSGELDSLRIRKDRFIPVAVDTLIVEGSRNCRLFEFGLAMARNGMRFEAILAALKATNADQCRPPLPEDEVQTIAKSASSYAADSPAASEIQWEDATPWPVLHDAALHGFAGEFVRVTAPQTEADPAALLATFLTMYGNAVACADGSSPYVQVGPVKHAPRLFTLIVGATAKSRKGQSYSEVCRIFEIADPVYLESVEISGLSTGEGLIAHLADLEESKDDDDCEDESKDKRAFVHESEFGRVLTAAARTDCTLSPVIRDAWDGRTLRVLTRKQPLAATKVHISILGHITQDELCRKTTDTDIANGLLNRFSLIAAKRSKLLPHGGNLRGDVIKNLGDRLGILIRRSRRVGEVCVSPEAAELWDDLYRNGFKDEKGLAGAAVARGEPITLRLALIYALLDERALNFDGTCIIQAEHLQAAYTLWHYIDASTKHILGNRIGNPIADRLLVELRANYPNGLDLTQQRDLFARHATESQLCDARVTLESRRFIRTVRLSTGGRPKQISFAIPRSECSEGSDGGQPFRLA